MKFKVCHHIEGRMRVQFDRKRFNSRDADTIEHALSGLDCIESVSVRSRIGSAVIRYRGDAGAVFAALEELSLERAREAGGLESYIAMSGREINDKYRGRLILRTAKHIFMRTLAPRPLRSLNALLGSIKYIGRGLRSLARLRCEMSVLDATAVAISLMRRHFSTATSVMFLMGIGETLEEWTRKKSVGDLARSLSLHIDKVSLIRGGTEVIVPASEAELGDRVIVRMGGMIPFDGDVVSGEALVNQASMTGEAAPVRKAEGISVFAGTTVEEGELVIAVRELSGSGRFEKLAAMIEESEKLKSAAESKASRLADQLAPCTLAGAVAVYAMTHSVEKALAVLMVDFSCALKLSMPLAVLAAIRDAGAMRITVKGGKFMEAAAEARTIVFDKTGTLTKAAQRVREVVPLNGGDPDELLRVAACIEEHFPHPIARSVVSAAELRGLEHQEMHSEVENIIAHGIATRIDGKRVVIGSRHFVTEDEGCVINETALARYEAISDDCSWLYLAIDGVVEAIICVEDPLREDAPDAVRALRAAGFDKIVMMTGDNERTARRVAEHVGVDEYRAEALPEDKARFIAAEREAGRRVIMVGDGVNDTPALSRADVGIAISDGAATAREIADVTIAGDDLGGIIRFRELSCLLMDRIHKNYATIAAFNSALIGLGLAGALSPAANAFLHNASTLMISLKSAESMLPRLRGLA